MDNLVLQGGADLQGYGNGVANAIFGNAGNNILDGGAGADSMSGGAGNDTYFVDNIGDVVIENAGEGNDTVFASGHDRLTQIVENLTLPGSADLQPYGNTVANTLLRQRRQRYPQRRRQRRRHARRRRQRLYFVDNAGDVVTENVGEGNDTVFSTAHFALSANLENLVLQGGADLQGYGNGLANAFFGNTGNNLLDGGAGADSMSGGAGNDIYFVDNAGDVVTRTPARATTRFSRRPTSRCRRTWKTWSCKAAPTCRATATASRTRSSATAATTSSMAAAARLHERGCRQRHLFRRQCWRRGDRERRPGQRRGLLHVNYALTANVETLVLQGGADLQGFGNALANASSAIPATTSSTATMATTS